MRTNDDVTLWRLFFRVVERGSITKAARDLQLEPSSVSRRITALEERLNLQLFVRTTRKIALTEAGEKAYERMRAAIAEMDAVVADLGTRQPTLEGAIRVTAPVNFGEQHVTSWLVEFQRKHPAVVIDLVLSDRSLDLMSEDIDVAIRIGHLPVSRLMARRLGTMSNVLVASPAYLAAYGAPDHPRDLPRHRAIIYSWRWERNLTRIELKRGSVVTSVELSASFYINNVGAIHRAALDGVGIHAGPRWLFKDALESGDLVALLPEWSLSALPVHLVRLNERYTSQRVTALFDWIAERWKSSGVNR